LANLAPHKRQLENEILSLSQDVAIAKQTIGETSKIAEQLRVTRDSLTRDCNEFKTVIDINTSKRQAQLNQVVALRQFMNTQLYSLPYHIKERLDRGYFNPTDGPQVNKVNVFRH